jgi:hypothetical protein
MQKSPFHLNWWKGLFCVNEFLEKLDRMSKIDFQKFYPFSRRTRFTGRLYYESYLLFPLLPYQQMLVCFLETVVVVVFF